MDFQTQGLAAQWQRERPRGRNAAMAPKQTAAGWGQPALQWPSTELWIPVAVEEGGSWQTGAQGVPRSRTFRSCSLDFQTGRPPPRDHHSRGQLMLSRDPRASTSPGECCFVLNSFAPGTFSVVWEMYIPVSPSLGSALPSPQFPMAHEDRPSPTTPWVPVGLQLP